MGRRRRRHSAGPGIAIGHCGLLEAALRLIIPIHNEAGQLVAYCGRSLDGTGPRYKFPAGFAKSR